jgi:MarR family transcriptional regulator, organic hydroperoxide resistance regulator
MPKASKARNGRANPLTVSRPQLLIRGSDHAFRQFVHDTLAFATRIQAIRNALGGVIGLSGTQYTILIAVAREQHKKGVGINHIADQLHFSPAFVTIEVNKLVAARLVSKAEDLLRNLTVVQRPVNDMLFESLSAEDFDRMRRKMTNLVDHADRAIQLLEFLPQKGGLRALQAADADS